MGFGEFMDLPQAEFKPLITVEQRAPENTWTKTLGYIADYAEFCVDAKEKPIYCEGDDNFHPRPLQQASTSPTPMVASGTVSMGTVQPMFTLMK